MDVVPVGATRRWWWHRCSGWPDFGAGAGRPDIALFYATPGAMSTSSAACGGRAGEALERRRRILLKPTVLGRALKTANQPVHPLLCRAPLAGGVLDDEMLMALKACPDIARSLAGMQALAGERLRYPFDSYGIQQDARPAWA